MAGDGSQQVSDARDYGIKEGSQGIDGQSKGAIYLPCALDDENILLHPVLGERHSLGEIVAGDLL